MSDPSKASDTPSTSSEPSSGPPPITPHCDIQLDPVPYTDRDFFLVTVELPGGGTTDPLPLLIADVVYFTPLGKVRGFVPCWQKKLFSRVVNGLQNHLDLHDLDPNQAFIESLQTLFYDPNKEINLHIDSYMQLFYNLEVNTVPIWPTALHQHLHGHNLQTDVKPHNLRIRFLGRAQRLLKEVLLPASSLSVSDPANSPELRDKFALLIQDILRDSFALPNSSIASPSTPITRNTTPTLNLSSDASTFPTPPTA
jgi:hypothetical protein